ncbi:MAG TPA: gfo/Idh/MocA family oxidoreductase, partial [Anaerolineae bacterium]
KNGALGILDTSWVHRAGPNPYEIYGTDGYMSLGVAPNSGLLINSTQLKAGDIQGYISPTNLPKAPPMPMDQWLNAILNGTPMTITVEDGRNLTELLEGTYQSARGGKEVVF